MREYKYWVDHLGMERKVIASKGRLNFRVPLHASLRAFIFIRDSFRCGICSVSAYISDSLYNGTNTLRCKNPPGFPSKNAGNYLVIDHVVSLKNGGNNHPENLQTLCHSCNIRKANIVDRNHSIKGDLKWQS